MYCESISILQSEGRDESQMSVNDGLLCGKWSWIVHLCYWVLKYGVPKHCCVFVSTTTSYMAGPVFKFCL